MGSLRAALAMLGVGHTHIRVVPIPTHPHGQAHTHTHKVLCHMCWFVSTEPRLMHSPGISGNNNSTVAEDYTLSFILSCPIWIIPDKQI